MVVPELNDYSFRLLQIRQPSYASAYPVIISYYGSTDVKTVYDFSFEKFEETLLSFISDPITKYILGSFKKQVENKDKVSNIYATKNLLNQI